MKKTCTVLFLVATLLSCSKKKEAAATTPVVTSPVQTPHQISAKVNGNLAYCDGCYSGSASGGIREAYFTLSDSVRMYYSSTGMATTGTFSLSKTSNPELIYIKNNVYYHAVTGAFTITSVDTSQKGVPVTLIGSFNFKTDTSNGAFFTITDGLMYVKN